MGAPLTPAGLPSRADSHDDERARHDFKNQLAIIRGFSEILMGEADPADPRRRDLHEIHTAAVKALELLSRMYPSADCS